MKPGVMAAFGRALSLCALACGVSACATVVGGTTQGVLIESDPPGAECQVDRQGSIVGVVKATPGRVSVSRDKEDIIVSCTLDRHEPSSDVISSKFTGATVGNILLGGIVGAVVDASSGANNKYPERVIVIMSPLAFSSETARDTHFSAVEKRIHESAAAEVKRITGTCNSNNRELCREEGKPVIEARDRAIEEIKRKRLAAKIGPKA